MNRGFSVWLDVLRVTAALAVLMGHFAHAKFSGGTLQFLRDWSLGPDAVIVFFVISGLVIAYAADRDASGRLFAFNRATRLLTVIVPAIVLTVLFDTIGRWADPAAYPPNFYAEIGLIEALARGASFSNEWAGWVERVRIGTNGALWSLSYEATYYAAFGVAVFLRGALRIALLALIVLLAGVPILALAPAWLVGVLVWRMLSRDRPEITRRAALARALLPLVLAAALKIAGLPEVLLAFTVDSLAPWNAYALLGYSHEVLWHILLAALIAVHLRYAALCLRAVEVDETRAPLRALRWVAGASFSIYVVHYPTLHLLDAVLPNDMLGHNIVMLALTLLVCLVFAQFFERPLAFYRWAALEAWHRVRSGMRAVKLPGAPQRTPERAE